MIRVSALSSADVDEAGALLAARHRAERARFGLLPSAYDDPSRCAALVGETMRFCDGAAARDGDRLLGFLTAFESAPDPASPMARYLPERAAIHLAHGHAVAGGVAPFPVYAALFADLAGRAVTSGVTDFVVHCPIGDPDVEAAWVALGFGRINAVAIRSLELLDIPLSDGVSIRIATPDDLDTVQRLVDEEPAFHAAPPMFQPLRQTETAAAVRAEIAGQLSADDHAFVLARRSGRDVGVLSIAPGRGSPLYVPDGAVYISSTAVLADERGHGIGAGLVDAAFRWAIERDHRAACLHFATANVVSTSFWTGIGFVPVMAHFRRRLDRRVLGSDPPLDELRP